MQKLCQAAGSEQRDRGNSGIRKHLGMHDGDGIERSATVFIATDKAVPDSMETPGFSYFMTVVTAYVAKA